MGDAPEERPESEDESPYSGVVWAPRAGLQRVAVACLGLAALLTAIGLAVKPPFLVMASIAILPIAAAIAYLVGRRPRSIASQLIQADREGLVVDGRRLARREDIGGASLEQTEDGHWVVHLLLRDSPAITVGVRDRQDGKDFIDALELDARSRVAKFVVTRGSPVVALLASLGMTVAALVALLALPSLPPPIRLGVLAAVVCVAVLSTPIVTVIVGADGIRLSRLLRRPRLIPHDAIASVAREGTDVVVRLRDGEEMRWPMAIGKRPPQTLVERATNMADNIVRRILEARAVFEDMRGDVSALPLLARAGRTPAEWLTSLRRVGDEAAGFRQGVVGRERLWDLVESAQTPAAARLGAAVALRVSPDAEPAKKRLAELAEQCASPELATRIRVVAEGDDAKLEALLAELAEEEAAAEATGSDSPAAARRAVARSR